MLFKVRPEADNTAVFTESGKYFQALKAGEVFTEKELRDKFTGAYFERRLMIGRNNGLIFERIQK